MGFVTEIEDAAWQSNMDNWEIAFHFAVWAARMWFQSPVSGGLAHVVLLVASPSNIPIDRLVQLISLIIPNPIHKLTIRPALQPNSRFQGSRLPGFRSSFKGRQNRPHTPRPRDWNPAVLLLGKSIMKYHDWSSRYRSHVFVSVFLSSWIWGIKHVASNVPVGFHRGTETREWHGMTIPRRYADVYWWVSLDGLWHWVCQIIVSSNIMEIENPTFTDTCPSYKPPCI